MFRNTQTKLKNSLEIFKLINNNHFTPISNLDPLQYCLEENRKSNFPCEISDFLDKNEEILLLFLTASKSLYKM